MRTYFENLDSLRALAFFVVFISHSIGLNPYYSYAQSHWIRTFFNNYNIAAMGVNLFFVLSGFLITFLLLTEKKHNNKINIFHFYLRRILRIWPLYYLLVLIAIGLSLLKIAPAYIMSFNSVLHYLLFLANFDLVSSNGGSSILVGMLWSVAIEEQFYLTWPIALLLFQENAMQKILLFVIGSSFLFRIFNFNNEMVVNYSTISVMADIAIGCLSAFLVFDKPNLIEYFFKLTKNKIVIFYLLGFLGLIFFGLQNSIAILQPFLVGLHSIFAAIFFAFIILEQNYSKNSFLKFGNIKFLSNIGKYTYGLYCFHIGIILLIIYLANLFHIHTKEFNVYIYAGEILSSGVISLLISIISYNYFESIFLKLKSKFA